MALRTGSTENGILPISVRQSAVTVQIRKQFGRDTFPRVGTHAVRIIGRSSRIGIQIGIIVTVLGKLRKLVGVHHIKFLRYILYAVIAVILYLHFFRLPLFGRNNNNAIGTAATIDSGRRSVFQHFYRLNVVVVEIGKATFHRHAVYDIKRIATGIDGTDATHADTYVPFRITAWSSHLYTRHLSCQCLAEIRSRCLGYVLRFHRRYGSGHIALLLDTIAHDHHFFQQFTILFQGYVGERFVSGRESSCFITDK